MSEAAKERFKRAEQAARKGNYEYAIELYLQGLTLNPNAADERRMLHEIEARFIEESGGSASGGLGAKLKAAPMMAKAKKLAMQKKWDEAVLAYEQCLRTQPRNTTLLMQLAQCLEELGAVDSAIGTLEEVIAVDKTHVEAYRKLGQLMSARGEIERAIEYWEKLRMYKPEDKEAAKAIRDLSAQSMVKKAEERKEETGDESFRAMLKSEEEAEELEKKAKVIRTDEDRRQAIRFKLEEIKKDPKNSRLWRELGALYQDLKDWKHAFAAYKKALEVNPHDLFAHDKIGALREQRKDEELKELREKVEAARKNGVSPDELNALEQELAAKEAEVLQFKIKEYERRVKAHPTDYELKLRYARYLMQGGEYDRAIEQLQKAVKDPKIKVAAQNFMGQCFAAKGVYQVAVSQYLEALKHVADPDSDLAKEIKYNLALASEQQGDIETALKYYQEIMAVDISYRDVSTRVDQLMRSPGGPATAGT